MDLWDVFEKRRTIRKFSAPPNEGQLKRLLKAGSMAPSSGNKQAWFVVVVKDPETREKIAEIKKAWNATWAPDTKKGRAMLEMQEDAFNNSTSIVVYTFAPESNDPHRSDHRSACLFIENFLLATVPEGLGAHIFALHNEPEIKVNQLLKVPKKYRQVLGINVGIPHPDYKIPNKIFKPVSKWVFKECWSKH